MPSIWSGVTRGVPFCLSQRFLFRFAFVHNLTLKMPGEPGELEAMSYAFRGCTGLQHEVIAMASCCKGR